MVRWEYRLYPLPSDPALWTDDLNTLGFEGWELVAIVEVHNDRYLGRPVRTTAVFKRPLPATKEQG